MDAIGCYFLNNLVLCLYAQRKNDNVLLLKERERMLFISLYGLDETDTRNHTEMAAELGLCKERIRQLEVKVFKKFYLLQRRKYVPVIWGIERSGFFNGREKWAKGFENQRV